MVFESDRLCTNLSSSRRDAKVVVPRMFYLKYIEWPLITDCPLVSRFRLLAHTTTIIVVHTLANIHTPEEIAENNVYNSTLHLSVHLATCHTAHLHIRRTIDVQNTGPSKSLW